MKTFDEAPRTAAQYSKQGGINMSGFLSVGSRILLSVFFLALLLQGSSIEAHAEGMKADGETPDVNAEGTKGGSETPCIKDCDECFKGCNPGPAAGHSAVGFKGLPSPTPVTAGTCLTGQYCQNPTGLCGLGNKKKCVSTYTYSTQACACTCP